VTIIRALPALKAGELASGKIGRILCILIFVSLDCRRKDELCHYEIQSAEESGHYIIFRRAIRIFLERLRKIKAQPMKLGVFGI
jgi:hypothetical protein